MGFQLQPWKCDCGATFAPDDAKGATEHRKVNPSHYIQTQQVPAGWLPESTKKKEICDSILIIVPHESSLGCSLPEGHDGMHRYRVHDDESRQLATIWWEFTSE